MSNGVEDQSRNQAWVTGAYFWKVIDDLKAQMLRGTWVFGSGAPGVGVPVDGQFYLDISSGDLYYNASGVVSIIFTFTGGTGGVVLKSISAASFPSGVINTSTLGPQYDLTGKTPDVNFMLFTDSTLSERIKYNATLSYWTFAGTTITLVNGAEDVFLFIVS